MKRLLHTAAHIVFLLRNFWYTKNMRPVQWVHYKGFAIGPLSNHHVDAALTLYKKLNNEKNLGTAKTLLLKIFGTRLCLAAYNKDNQLIGISLYYFNARDKKENSIHEGYTGVDPRFQNKGLGTELRRLAASHFFSCGLKAISSRVSADNKASFRSALKLGFEPVETYWDSKLGEKRYYMVCRRENFK